MQRLEMESTATVRVSYLELLGAPAPPLARARPERIAQERLRRPEYLPLYQRVGGPVRWDQRLSMSQQDLDDLLAGEHLSIYVLRNAEGEALGFCEFDRSGFPDIELKNFGVVPEAQGRGLGSWLLAVALSAAWGSRPTRIWLHTDEWDHPAAIPLYLRAGFQVYAVHDQPAGPL